MSITSMEFLGFILLAAVLYYIIPLRFRWVSLLVCSAVYLYTANDIRLLLVMFIAIVVAYLAGIFLEKKKSKFVLGVSLLFIAGILLYLKEINFFLGIVRMTGVMFGQTWTIPNLQLIAPLGISYYTLNLVSYVLDVYWGVAAAQKNFFKFVLFAGYFPAMVSGPIIRYREIEEQLYAGHKITYQNISFGIQRILWGVFKKLVISERLAIIVNTVYGDYNTYTGLYIFVAIVCFVFQLYTDFSGCIDIVLGVSELFGIILPENFQTPFFSRSASEFWRRWHITLGAWLKDYILYPILKTTLWQKIGQKLKARFGKKAAKKIPVWLGLFCSWFLIGMWHGGSWNYIFGSGLLWWMLIVLGEACEPIFRWSINKLKINTECFSWRLFQSMRTFGCFAFGLSFFRSYGGLMEGVKLWKSALSTFNPWILFDGSLYNLGLDEKNFRVMLIALVVLGISGIMREQIKRPIREWLAEQNIVFRWGMLLLLVFSIAVFGMYGPGYNAQAFIYEQF